MGRSDPINKPSIYQYLSSFADRNNSPSILDLGMGSGEFGIVARAVFGERATIDGVEVWEKYRNPLWRAYNSVKITDIRQFEIESNKYDLIFLIDVLEHLDQQEAETLLNRIEKAAKKAVLLSTPTTEYPQEELGVIPMKSINTFGVRILLKQEDIFVFYPLRYKHLWRVLPLLD